MSTEIPKGETYHGGVCKKHPELKGKRYLSNRVCFGCSASAGKTNWEKSRDKTLTMENLLTQWKEVGGPPELMAKTEEVLAMKEKVCSKCNRVCSFLAHFCRGCGEML